MAYGICHALIQVISKMQPEIHIMEKFDFFQINNYLFSNNLILCLM